MRLDERKPNRNLVFPAFLFGVAAAFFCAAGALPARGDEAARILTLEECLVLAEAHHPNLAGADARTEAER